MSKKSHHFLTLWPWPLTYDLEKLIRSGHYHYQCVYQIWEQSIPWFLRYRVNTIAVGGRRVAGDGRFWRKTITSPDPSDTGDIINRAPNLTYSKLCASFHSHRSIQTVVTVQKRQIRVKIGDFLPRVTLKFDRWSSKIIWHLLYAISSCVHDFIAICEFKPELQSGNG